jgi:adenylate cyclase
MMSSDPCEYAQSDRAPDAVHAARQNERRQRQVASIYAICVGALVAALTLLATTDAGLSIESAHGARFFYWLRGSRAAPENIVIVSLDDWTAHSVGDELEIENWPRELYACGLERLNRLGASLIISDIFFDPAHGVGTTQNTRRIDETVRDNCHLSTGEVGTERLAKAIESARNVLLASHIDSFTSDGPAAIHIQAEVAPDMRLATHALAVAPFPLSVSERHIDRVWTFYPLRGHELLISTMLAVGAYAMEHCPRDPAADTAPPKANRNCANVRAALEAEPGLLASDAGPKGAPTRAELPTRYGVPVDNGVSFLNLYGPPGHMRTLRYSDLLTAPSDDHLESLVRGRTIVIGAAQHTGSHQIDSYVTAYPGPATQRYSGVELLATGLANLIDGSGLKPLYGWERSLVVGVLGTFMGAAGWILSPVPFAWLAIVVVFTYSTASAVTFAVNALWMPIVIPVAFLVPLIFLGAVIGHYRRTQILREYMRSVAEAYIPNQALDMHLNAQVGQPSSRLINGVVLATDAEGFTRMVERSQRAPLKLVPYLGEYYSALTSPIDMAAPPGIIIDAAGDGILAIWESTARGVIARRAGCSAALAIVAGVKNFNARHRSQNLPTCVGLHVGELVLGDIATRQHLFFKAVGDVTNTASRVERLNRTLGTSLLATREVVEGLEQELLLRPCGRFQLYGKSAVLDIFEVLADRNHATEQQRQLVADFAVALTTIKQIGWEPARHAFSHLAERHPDDGPTRFYVKRCEEALRNHGGLGIDDIVVLNSK